MISNFPAAHQGLELQLAVMFGVYKEPGWVGVQIHLAPDYVFCVICKRHWILSDLLSVNMDGLTSRPG